MFLVKLLDKYVEAGTVFIYILRQLKLRIMSDIYTGIEAITIAVYQLLEEGTSVDKLEDKHNLLKTTVKRYYDTWAHNAPDSHSLSFKDIHINLCQKCRKPILTDNQEHLIR